MGYLDSAGLRHLWTKLEEVFSAKQDLLVGNSGQVVGFGVSGTVEAQNGWSNPNLLDNWYFADPVNQRGEKEYRNDTYTIDRWISDCSESRPLSVKGTGVAVIGDTALCQRFPKGQFDPSDVFTFSVLYEDGGFSSCTGTFHTGPSSVAGEIAVEMAASEAYDSIRFCRTDRSVSTIVAAKLEHGDLGPSGCRWRLGAQRSPAEQGAGACEVSKAPIPYGQDAVCVVVDRRRGGYGPDRFSRPAASIDGQDACAGPFRTIPGVVGWDQAGYHRPSHWQGHENDGMGNGVRSRGGGRQSL